MKTLEMDNRIFEVVEELPWGYQIWNIGRHNFKFENYIPLCQVNSDLTINPNTLKALKLQSEELALKLMDLSITKLLTHKQLRELLK